MCCEASRIIVCARAMAASIFGCLLLALTGCSDPLLWEPVETEPGPPPTPQAIRSETVSFDIKLLRPPSNRSLRLKLPGRDEITIVLAKFEDLKDQQFIWRGTIKDEPGSEVRFSVFESTVVGAIVTASGQTYMIRTIRDGVALVEELDTTRFPREDATEPPSNGTVPESPVGVVTGSEPPVERAEEGSAPESPIGGVIGSSLPVERAESGSTSNRFEFITTAQAQGAMTLIKVLVLYTSAAEDYLSQRNGAAAGINLLVSDTRDSLIKSGVPVDLQLAQNFPTEYSDTDDAFKDWEALKHSKDITAFEKLGDMRNQYGADIVVLLTNSVSVDNPSSCGQADKLVNLEEVDCNSVFAAVPANCAVNIYSFAHEIGHVMGARHGQGFIAKSNSWYTIMASPKGACKGPACKRIPRWSNPTKTFANGALPPESTGSDSANNASRLNVSRTTVAEISDKCGQGGS